MNFTPKPESVLVIVATTIHPDLLDARATLTSLCVGFSGVIALGCHRKDAWVRFGRLCVTKAREKTSASEWLGRERKLGFFM